MGRDLLSWLGSPLQAPLGWAFTSAALLLSLNGALAQGLTGSSVNILWRAPARQSLAIQQGLRFMGTVTADTSTQSDSRSPAEVFVLAGAVNLDLLAKALLSNYREDRYGGLLVRSTGNGGLLISNDPALAAGTILFDQGAKGKTMVNALGQPRAEQLVELLRPMLP